MDEATLIRQAQAGDDWAWEQLMAQHAQAAFRLAYLMVGDPASAEDVAQEAFIRAFRALARFDSERPFRPWLLRITANAARNQRRAWGRYLYALRRLFQAEPPRPTMPEQKEEAWALWQAIRRLRPIDQEIIYLRYFLELSEQEAAEALDIAPGTVKSRLHRALARLREVVKDEFPTLYEERDGAATV